SVLIGDFAEIANFEWVGNIDDVRIYNRALTADEIKLFYYPFDINDDKIINIYDLEIVAERWLDDGGLSTADTNGDGVVNFEDYREVANSFDERVPPEEPQWKSLMTVERGIPEPLAGNPGNIFLEGDEVTVEIPSAAVSAASWEIIDDNNNVVAAGDMPDVSASGLGIGWYWVSFLNSSDVEITHSTAAVLAQLKAPTPQDSPVCLDLATSWFYNNTLQWQQYANLATLAGINVIRDRITWATMEPTEGNFVADGSTKYDETADIQTAAGLKILQVFHSKPSWSPIYGEGYPEDLRHLYNFCKEMTKRFKGKVHAWEPWNEANANNFGKMTIDEMSCLQKAAYIGFKAGDPDITVGWNPYGGISVEVHTIGVLKNEAWNYFDTYNSHTYEPPVSYNDQWTVLREAACGKPIWITESNRHMDVANSGYPFYDFDYSHEILKANFMAQSYASAVYAGASRHFHFILGAYSSSPQILRRDFTPRAHYVSLAATGRFMAGAKPIGRRYEADITEPNHVYAFHAKPDGVESDLIVAWAERYRDGDRWGKTVTDWPITESLEAKAVYDYL
ncbi:MAG: hypothetical protein KAS96_05565, partial [Planctomycetes bacterium]|nr:hypothetical protein [Planctomycetota bacterium]